MFGQFQKKNSKPTRIEKAVRTLYIRTQQRWSPPMYVEASADPLSLRWHGRGNVVEKLDWSCGSFLTLCDTGRYCGNEITEKRGFISVKCSAMIITSFGVGLLSNRKGLVAFRMYLNLDGLKVILCHVKIKLDDILLIDRNYYFTFQVEITFFYSNYHVISGVAC